MSEPLLREINDGVALLTFNRPDRANTWSADLHVSYLQTLAELAKDEDVRAVVVTGAGRHFCAGADMSLLEHIQGGGGLPAELDAESFLEPLAFPKPLVAAVNGSAAGLGLINALMCDVRFASDAAVFTTAFTRRGLVAEHGVSWLLPQIVGRAHALDLLMSARRVPASEAREIGLVHQVCAPEDLVPRALAYAHDLAQNCSPAAIMAVKRQVTRHATLQLAEAEAETVGLVEASLEGADFSEGVKSFLEKRPARFEPLGRGTTFPSLDAAPVDPDRVAEQFFAATSHQDWEAALQLLSPDARLVTYPGPPEVGVEGLAASWQKLRDAFGPWEYLNVRRISTADCFCEQHTARFTDLGVDVEACVVARLDNRGLITRLEEYADGSALREAYRRHRDAQRGADA